MSTEGRSLKLERTPHGWQGGKGWRWMVLDGDSMTGGTERWWLVAWLRMTATWIRG